MHSKLYRWNRRADCTLGILALDPFRCHTIERPWIPADSPGGKPFESCVPTGIYHLEPFTRPSGDEVYMLVNEDLGVFRFEHDLGDSGGRYLVLIHKGNWSKDVVGCVAPGLTQTVDQSQNPMVGSSARAMRKVMEALDSEINNTLEIIDI